MKFLFSNSHADEFFLTLIGFYWQLSFVISPIKEVEKIMYEQMGKIQ